MGRFVVPLVFLLVGGSLAGVGGWMLADRNEFVASAEQVTGTVTAVRSRRDSEGDVTYAPVYTYTYEGEQREHTPNATTSSQPTVGETATLFVGSPDDPGRVMADTFMDRWFVPGLLAALGGFFLLTALGTGVAMLKLSATRRAASSTMRRAEDALAPRRGEDVTSDASRDVSSTRSTGPFVDGDSDPRGPFL